MAVSAGTTTPTTPTTSTENEGDARAGTRAELSRRSVLRRGAVAGATIIVAGTGVLSYRVFDTAVLDPDGGHAFDPWRNWRDHDGPLGAVAAAILAANPHNSQSWIFAVTGSAVDVYADATRRLGTTDVVDREMHIGLGCAIENLVIAARARGLAPTVTLLPDGSTGDHAAHVAHVAFAEAAPEASELYDVIGDRHSNRGPFKASEVAVDVLEGIVDTASLPGVAVHWVSDSAGKTALGQLMVDAATAITGDDEQSRDAFAWFRSNEDAIERHRDGLTLDEQGLAPAMLTIAKLIPASSRATGDRFWVTQTRDVHVKTAAAYGIVTVADPYDVSTQLLGGRLLQRTHLAATAAGVALQHMNQITERIDRERSTGSPPTFGPQLADLLPTGVQPLVAFRVGYAARDAQRSPRRPLSDVTR